MIVGIEPRPARNAGGAIVVRVSIAVHVVALGRSVEGAALRVPRERADGVIPCSELVYKCASTNVPGHDALRAVAAREENCEDKFGARVEDT